MKLIIKRRLPILLFFIAPLFAGAQELTGVWHGHFRSNNSSARSSLFDDRYKFEVQLAQNAKSVQAVTYSYLSSVFYGKAAADGAINVHTGKVLLQEEKLLECRNVGMGDVCIMTCFLQYSKSGDEEFLEGSYVSMNVRDSSNCGRGTVYLRKVASSDFYEEPFLVKKEKEIEKKALVKTPDLKNATASKPPAAAIKKNPAPVGPPTAKTSVPKPLTKPMTAVVIPKKNPPIAKTDPPGTDAKNPKTTTTPKAPVVVRSSPPMARASMPGDSARRETGDNTSGIGKKFVTIPPQVLRTRGNPVVKNLVVNTNEVVLNIYDDGAIDHDTISVYLDNRLVIDHAMLTDRPIVLTLHMNETNDYHELVMVAENEGEIPPNTSLMIVKAGDKEYEVRITSTEQKNAVVTFKFEKPK